VISALKEGEYFCFKHKGETNYGMVTRADYGMVTRGDKTYQLMGADQVPSGATVHFAHWRGFELVVSKKKAMVKP
jgi:hypothetical protein